MLKWLLYKGCINKDKVMFKPNNKNHVLSTWHISIHMYDGY